VNSDELEGQTRQERADDNVVRFPRDWLGPLDELVPFGPSATADAPDAGGRAEVVDLRPCAPLGAADFWGEGSAAIHDVMQAPQPAEQPVPSGTAPPRPASPARRGGESHADGPRWSRRALLFPRRLSHRVVRHERSGRPLAVAVAAAATLAIAIGYATFAGTVRGPSRLARRGGEPQATGRVNPLTAWAPPPILNAPPRLPARRVTPTRPRARPAAANHSRAGSVPTSVTPPARVSTAVPTESSASQVTPTYVRTTSPRPPEATQSVVPSAPSREQPTAGSHSGSPSPPAFGANGVLAPGTSGDG